VILGLDVSNHQGVIDFAAARSAGRDFCVIKATQGVSFADPYLAASRAKAHAAGMVVGLYQFADMDAPVADARWFLSHVGPLQPNEFLVLDEEVQQPNKVAWCQTWMQTVHAATGTWPLIYMNGSTASGYDWAPIAATCGLWLARYDGSTTQPGQTGAWSAPAMKQYSDAGSVLGVSAPCDVDVFYGTADQLRAYGTQGSTDMPLTQAEKDEIVNRTVIGVINRNIAGTDTNPIQLWEVLQQVYGKTVAETYDLTARPQDRPDDLLGHVLSSEARVRDLAAKVGQAATPTIDEAKLAAALLADPASVDALGKAIASHLKLASG
jgi:GH25 family lysozyme M1 (1,4-beta-N-acetylmuramidase)